MIELIFFLFLQEPLFARRNRKFLNALTSLLELVETRESMREFEDMDAFRAVTEILDMIINDTCDYMVSTRRIATYIHEA